MEARRRFGGMEFRNKIKQASNYKRMFNPTSGFSLNFLPGSGLTGKIVKISCILLILLGLYFFVFSPALLINNVTISGNRQVSTQQIEEALSLADDSRFFLVRKSNFFLMSQGRVNKLLTFNIPMIKGVVKYNRTWPNKASIEVVEHTPGFVIESNGSYFLVDDEGVVVNQVENPEKLLVVHDQLVENFVRGEVLANPKLSPFVISIHKSWNSKINTPIEEVRFPGKSSNDVQFITKAGFTVLFDTTRPMSVQLTNLAVILNKQVGTAQYSQLAYIDLRLSKWVYYCFKESACQQKEQPQTAGSETNAEQ